MEILRIFWIPIKLLFWLMVILAFLNVFLTYFILWLELRLTNLQQAQEGKQCSLPWQALITHFFIEFLCAFLSICLYPFRSLSLKAKTPPTDMTAPPILLVHGYLHTQHAWIWFMHQLQKKQGIGPIYTLNLSPPFASIAVLAEQVKEKINTIQRELGAKQIILIGHSMGGLVNSYFCEHLANPNEVAMVITIGSSFKGTKAAALALGVNGKEMAPNSPFLAKLLEKVRQSTVPYFSIASKLDNIIIPWESALIDNIDNTPSSLSSVPSNQTLIIEHLGHLSLLISPAVVEQVSKWIASSPGKTEPDKIESNLG